MKEKINHNLQEIIDLASCTIDTTREIFKDIEANNKLIKFKSSNIHNLEKEFWMCDSRLRFIFLAYCSYMNMKFKYTPTITCIYRHQAEQDNIYMGNKDYKIKPWCSVHQFWRGLDFRDRDQTPEMVTATLKFFEQVIYTGTPKTILRHSVNSKAGSHFHLQSDKDENTEIQKINQV